MRRGGRRWLNEHGLPSFEGQPADYGLQPDGRFKLKLEHPIKIGKGDPSPTTELTFRTVKGRDVRAFPFEPKQMSVMLDLAARLTRTTAAHMDALDGRDTMRVFQVASLFFVGEPGEIGKPLSGF